MRGEHDDSWMRASLKYGNARRGFAAVPSKSLMNGDDRRLTRGNAETAHQPALQNVNKQRRF
jgi:hypothetical protein